MNFLLSMLGRGVVSGDGLRIANADRAFANAASLATQGQFAEAVAETAAFAGEHADRGIYHAIRGHLHLLAQDYAAAEFDFSAALARWNIGRATAEQAAEQAGDETVDALADFPEAAEFRGTTLERLVGLADKNLRAGHYPRAVALLQRALSHVEAQLGGQAGLIVAAARRSHNQSPKRAEPLIPLARVGDALLRALARAHLAENLATSLRKRDLREDLALWAVGGACVEQLLVQQYEQLVAQARQHPSHIELHYRTGLLARTLGKLDEAQLAFSRVLRLHPHHLGAAARMAATCLETENISPVMAVLAVAFAVPAEMLARYRVLAQAAEDVSHFDLTVDALVRGSGESADARAIRANLAMALAELGVLDSAHARWRDPLDAAVTAH